MSLNSTEVVQLFNKLSAYIPGVVYQFKLFPDGSSCFPFASEGIMDIYGVTPDEVKQDSSIVLASIHPDDLELVNESIQHSARTLTTWNLEYRYNHKVKGLRWLHGFSNPEKLPDGSVIWHGMITDVTEKKEREREMTLTAEINNMIVYSGNTQELFEKACDIVIRKGNYLLAWVGLANYEKNILTAVAKSGKSHPYLENLPEISILDIEAGRGPSGRSFRENRVVVNNDINSSRDYELWKQRALSLNLKSSIALPLRVNERVIGTFNIYSSDIHYFDGEEISTLESITKNLSFALENLKIRNELKESENKFRTIFGDAPMGILLADNKSGEILDINETFKKILGRPNERVIGKTWMELTHPDDLQRDLLKAKKLNQDEISSFKSTKRFLRPDDSIAWAEILVVKFKKDDQPTRMNLVMANDVSERVKLEQNLKKSIHIKDEFIGIASHELKTPTTALLLQLQLIKRKINKGIIDLKSINIEIDKPIQLVNRLVDLISRLLDVTVMSGETIILKKETTNLSTLVREVLQVFNHEFNMAGCKVHLNLTPGIIADIDQIRIKQVLSILFDNAIKYAPHCEIDVTLFMEGDTKVLVIQDNGPGIKKEFLPDLFKRYERLEQDRKISGFGTGLYVARQIISAHGGKISVRSEVGKGTNFKIEF